VNTLKWSYCDQGDIIFNIDIELPKSIKDYVIEEEIKEEVKREQISAADEYDRILKYIYKGQVQPKKFYY